MQKHNIITVNDKDAIKLIEELVKSCKTVPADVSDYRFHHNSDLKSTLSILRYGILCNELRVEIVEKRKPTKEEEYRWGNNDSLICGNSDISVSSVIDDWSQMYRDEDVYTPFGRPVDIVLSSDIKARRSAQRYFNEFLVSKTITTDKFNSLDLNIFYVKDYYNKKDGQSDESYKAENMIKRYKYLKEYALLMKELNLDIPIRENSEVKNINEYQNSITLDKKKVLELPKIVLK